MGFVIYMFLSNNPSSGGYKFVEFVLFCFNSFVRCFVKLYVKIILEPQHDSVVSKSML